MDSFPDRSTARSADSASARRRFYLACIFATTSIAVAWLIVDQLLVVDQLQWIAAPVIFLIYSWIFVAIWVLAAHADLSGGFGKLSLARYAILILGIGLGMALAGIVGLFLLQGLGFGPGSSD